MIVKVVNVNLHHVFFSFFLVPSLSSIFFFCETSNFRNGSTSGPGRHITSCSNSKHVRYEGYGSPSVDPNLLLRSFNITLGEINLNGEDYHQVICVWLKGKVGEHPCILR